MDHPKQQWQPQQGAGNCPSNTDMFIHALLPSQLAKGCIPSVSIVECTSALQRPQGDSDSRRGQRDQEKQPRDVTRVVTVVDKAQMHQMGSDEQPLTHWCYGPITLEQGICQASSSSKKRASMSASPLTATVTLQLPRQGLLPLPCRKVQLEQELMQGCRHHFVLQSCSTAVDKQAAPQAAAEAAAMVAAMIAAVVEQLQAGAELPLVTEQLTDLVQQCIASHKPHSRSASFIANVVLLLAQQLHPASNHAAAAAAAEVVIDMDWQEDAAAGPALTEHQPLPAAAAAAAAAVLTAHTAIRLLGHLPAAVLARELEVQQLQQLQQAVSVCLQALTQLLQPVEALPAAAGGSSSATTTTALSAAKGTSPHWLQQLQRCLGSTLSIGCMQNVLGCCNLQQDATTWLSALPALVSCMRQPSLSFLFGVKNLPTLPLLRQSQQQSQQQKDQQVQCSPESCAGAAAGMFQQLAVIDPKLFNEPASSSLLSAVLAVAPGPSGRLHSLLLYLLKAAKGDRAFSWLQQAAQAAAQQPHHPLRQCFIELFGLGTAGDCTALMQQQQLLLLDPFR